jgi:hypothetical protein
MPVQDLDTMICVLGVHSLYKIYEKRIASINGFIKRRLFRTRGNTKSTPLNGNK